MTVANFLGRRVGGTAFQASVSPKLREWGFIVLIFSFYGGGIAELRRLTNTNPSIIRVYLAAVYFSWKDQNSTKHAGIVLLVLFTAMNILITALQLRCNLILEDWDVNLHSEFLDSWHPPPLDWIKINVDASLMRSNLRGIGGV
ncbi:hypothetical protein IEQ34_006508 [Dendrobium chrysotoxum]|uniref:Uncharacterized protein n=1 Tax=Dendrobium chrysotoxum TaxID=161865 RepID=A0AAV7H464_DENCH|nr:hypothetical protein IEQ34_006508 [Dendrobium chrysotoxum]